MLWMTGLAAFVAIKHVGTNGGGFFGANAAHPYENPTFLANMILVVSHMLLPLACVWAFGHITGRRRVAAALFAAMLIMYVAGALALMRQEWQGNGTLGALGLQQPAGNLEGKEARFGCLAMLLGRYIPIIAPLALAACLGAKKTVPESAGTFRTDNAIFVFLLLAVIGIVGALLFLPVAVLGPVAESLAGMGG